MLSVVIGEEFDNEALAVSIKTGKKHTLQHYLHFSIAFIYLFFLEKRVLSRFLLVREIRYKCRYLLKASSIKQTSEKARYTYTPQSPPPNTITLEVVRQHEFGVHFSLNRY